MRRVGAILLAAGASTRLGKPKQLVMIGGENLLQRAVRVATEAACSPVVVVLGASAELIRKESILKGAQIVLNHAWQEGMASSIQAGVKALGDVDGALIMVCDMPAVTANHLRTLSASDEVMGTSYAGRHGVPAYFPKSMISTLMKLEGDTGARDILQAAPSIELPGGDLDIDTEQDVTIAQRRY